MNKERLLQVADAVEAECVVLPDGDRLGFRMSVFYVNKEHRQHGCGTVGCIAGHAVAMFDVGHLTDGLIGRRAMELLGLEFYQAMPLFNPYTLEAYAATGPQAAKVIRNLVETGRVDWSIISEPVILGVDYGTGDQSVAHRFDPDTGDLIIVPLSELEPA